MERGSNKNWIAAVVALVAVVLVGAGVFAYMNMDEPAEQEDTSQTATQSTENETQTTNEPAVAAEEQPTIVFTDDGFDKSTYTFAAGKAITVKNESSMDMQFSSDDHPSHRDHSELNMKLLGAGESGTFTPPGAGTYGFHDHINDQFEGTLVIQ